MGNDSEKSQGLQRAEDKETNSQKLANSDAAFHRNPGPAYGGSTKGNPTSGGKISRK